MTQKLHEAEQGFLKCWEKFGGDEKDFPLWNADWNEEELASRFEQITSERKTIYFGHSKGWFGNQKEPQNLDAFHFAPDALTPSHYTPSEKSIGVCFAYNLASPDYSASIIHLGGKRFLGMESPNEHTLETFFHILKEYQVSHIVRLTPAYEVRKARGATYPYWEGRTDIHPQSGKPTLKIEGCEITYIPTDCWENHEGLEPARLLVLVKTVMEDDPEMVAVHCHGGIGRTGTFIAACALISAIDKQLASGIAPKDIEVSIDKVIWELSLQRVLLVPHFSQYLTLHQLISYYLIES